MTLIAWRDEYSVGLPDVDHEHRVLIAMINELAEALGPETPHARIVGALGEICSRIAAHFALEEREGPQARRVAEDAQERGQLSAGRHRENIRS